MSSCEARVVTNEGMSSCGPMATLTLRPSEPYLENVGYYHVKPRVDTPVPPLNGNSDDQ